MRGICESAEKWSSKAELCEERRDYDLKLMTRLAATVRAPLKLTVIGGKGNEGDVVIAMVTVSFEKNVKRCFLGAKR